MTNPDQDPFATVRVHVHSDPTDPRAIRWIKDQGGHWNLITSDPGSDPFGPVRVPSSHLMANHPVQPLDEVARVLGHPDTQPQRPHVCAHVEVRPHNGKPFLGTVLFADGVHLWVTPDDAPNVAGRYLPHQLAVIT